MSTINTTEFKVGLTVIISTAILIFGIIWGKGFKLEPDKIEFRVQFDNIGGMVPGDPVTVNGVKEGKVKHIENKNRKVVTTLEISDNVQLYEDATFIVVSAELLAGMRVEIFPGRSKKNINMSKQPFNGEYGGRIVDVGLTIDELAKDMSSLTFRLDTTMIMVNDFLRKGQLQENINNTLNSLDKISASLREMIDDNSGSITVAIKNLKEGSEKFSTMIDSNEVSIKTTITRISSISTKLDTVSTSLQKIMKEVESKKGTLGKVVYDSTLYINLNKTLASLDSLSRQIKEEGLDIDLF